MNELTTTTRTFLKILLYIFINNHFFCCCQSEDVNSELLKQAGGGSTKSFVINTWPFIESNRKAWSVLTDGGSHLDSVEQGCILAESNMTITSVGYGNHPDETGETTLDALIIDGDTHDVGSVADLRRIRDAISVARHVLEHTSETLLVGESATNFAKMMGFSEQSLASNVSYTDWQNWMSNKCQPNFWKNVEPSADKSCGPYKPTKRVDVSNRASSSVSKDNHDTIGMIALDSEGRIAAGTSTNGADHKIPGRVGDSPIVGAGAYVDRDVGGAVATGDGDIMMRFLPAYQTVETMRIGFDPELSCRSALKRIQSYYPTFMGALVGVTVDGQHGAACVGFGTFQYTWSNSSTHAHVFTVKCA